MYVTTLDITTLQAYNNNINLYRFLKQNVFNCRKNNMYDIKPSFN